MDTKIASITTSPEQRIAELERFCTEAQSFYHDAIDPNTSRTETMRCIKAAHHVRDGNAQYNALLREANKAHCEWVDTSFISQEVRLKACERIAKAWLAILTYLNDLSLPVDFNIPTF